jgi:hypothetical protein
MPSEILHLTKVLVRHRVARNESDEWDQHAAMQYFLLDYRFEGARPQKESGKTSVTRHLRHGLLVPNSDRLYFVEQIDRGLETLGRPSAIRTAEQSNQQASCAVSLRFLCAGFPTPAGPG